MYNPAQDGGTRLGSYKMVKQWVLLPLLKQIRVILQYLAEHDLPQTLQASEALLGAEEGAVVGTHRYISLFINCRRRDDETSAYLSEYSHVK